MWHIGYAVILQGDFGALVAKIILKFTKIRVLNPIL